MPLAFLLSTSAAAHAAAGASGAAAAATALFAVLPDGTDGQGNHNCQNGDHQNITKHCLTSLLISLQIRNLMALAQQQIQQACQHSQSRHGKHAEHSLAAEETADLIDDHGDGIGKAAHIGDGAHGPLHIAHLKEIFRGRSNGKI